MRNRFAELQAVSLLPGDLNTKKNCTMKRVRQQTLAMAIAVCMTDQLSAPPTNPKYAFGLNLGFTVYQGDLTPERLGSFRTQRFAFGLHASRLISSSFSIRANFLRGRLKGDDALYSSSEYRQQRNFNFSSPVTEFTGQLVWNPLQRNYTDKGFSPYLFAGAGSVSSTHLDVYKRQDLYKRPAGRYIRTIPDYISFFAVCRAKNFCPFLLM